MKTNLKKKKEKEMKEKTKQFSLQLLCMVFGHRKVLSKKF